MLSQYPWLLWVSIIDVTTLWYRRVNLIQLFIHLKVEWSNSFISITISQWIELNASLVRITIATSFCFNSEKNCLLLLQEASISMTVQLSGESLYTWLWVVLLVLSKTSPVCVRKWKMTMTMQKMRMWKPQSLIPCWIVSCYLGLFLVRFN